jgi:ketosteroid isomerase-like protein
MSQENVEAQGRFGDAFRRGDWDAVAAMIDPHIAVRTDSRWQEQRFYGRESWLAFLRGSCEARGPENRVEEVVDLGDRVLTRSCWNIRGHHSGLAGEFRYSSIITYREGRSVFIEFFIEHEQALEALGVSE